ncbi:hypothetical protein GCM10010531_18820 [Blastococcus jejuensis]|uniref:OsmC-like protein n=1 Tax=Blastococcus jejuensis TaxID=351224 RepID=A0ABP6P401_9ACTN
MQVQVQQVQGHRLEVTNGTAVAVVDGQSGTGESFRSVELLLASLGSCMIGTMLTEAEKQGIEVSDVRVQLRPVVTMAPERVSRIRMTMTFKGKVDDVQLKILTEAAESCKVHNSLHNGVATSLEIVPES